MCFYNSQSKRALALAKRYGRKTDIIEIWQEIMEEKRRNGEVTELIDGAYNIPAFISPYSAIITNSDQLQPMRWGLISHMTKGWDVVKEKDKKNWYKNARGETLFSTWPYKLVAASQRCIIPSTGFFEYHENEDGTKVPFYVSLPEEEVFSIGGVWDLWLDPNTGDKILSYVMITTAANELMTEVHNSGQNPFRMPLILSDNDVEKWLNPNLAASEVNKLIVPFTNEKMAAYQVEKDFRKMENMHNPSIIEKVA